MKNITLKYYDIESGEQIISSEQIKSVKVIDEIDVTHMSNPTPVVDIVLKCTQDDDLEFDIDAQCDVCSGDTVLFEMYVSNSMRGSEYEWKLSLHGTLGHLANYKYYGDVYSAPEDYTSYEYFNEKRDYLPTVSTLKQIYESLSGISGITFDIDVSEFPVVEETLHKVGMPVCSVRDAILHISFLTGAFVNDANRKITFYKLNDTVKEISSTRILNDAKIEKIDISNINLHYYTYGMFRSGIGYFTSYQTVYEDYAGNNSLGYVRQGTSCYMCNIIPSDAYGGNYAPVGHNDIRVSVRGSANENEEIFFEKPVSSFNLPTDLYLGSYQGDTPTNPNYSPAGEILNRPIAVPYNISDQIINIKFSENGTTKDIEEHLLSREMVQAVSERVKSDFSYNRKAIVKIVDGFDKVYYGEHFYGEMTYGYTEQEPIDVGDRVSFTVRNKQVNGIVTRVSYNLNGTIKIKECEVMYKE